MQIILIGYGIFLILLALFGGAAVFHARKFGFPGDKTGLATLLYLVTVAVIVVMSFLAIGSVDFEEVDEDTTVVTELHRV